MTVITCHNLIKSFGQKKALNNLSITIEKNKLTGLIGRNGAGKTTLLKIIAGFMKKTSGNIKVFSEDPFNNLFISANTIFIDDQMNFPTVLTLGNILNEMRRFYDKWDGPFASRLFDYFSFKENEYYTNLSKGKKSTFNMIIGLASRCALTIYDEPTIGMDVATRQDFYRVLLKDYIAHPRTIILSSHHIDELEHILESILLIDNGRKVLHESIDDLKQYAIGITGESSKIQQLTANLDVIYTKEIDTNNSYVVIENDEPADMFINAGLSVTPISPSELSVYLTNERKRGIDNVFIDS